MREITEHQVDGKSHRTVAAAVDAPESGANCDYVLESGGTRCSLQFQRGPIGEPASRPGICHESLLAVTLDRLRGFQSTSFACDANAEAIAHIESALGVLQDRTRERMERFVEGTHTV